jgi:hypothetical protein|tara:strand:- start:72 stop:920 length:849 start_codon:yes stop_codon:yes gene_type:complete
MNIINGEMFQDLCSVQISKQEHKKFESNTNSIDIDNFEFNDFDNSELVYVNLSLLNTSKPKLVESNLYDKLLKLKNPFTLILHNSDDEFGEKQLKYLDIENCKKIYTRNINVLHQKVKPLPIGIANSFWKWGDTKILNEVIDEGFIDNNPYFIYANFTKGDGVRYERRKDCFDILSKNGIIMQDNTDYKSYLQHLKKHKFCLSPEGNGIDCHRTWEALYMKTIPICKRSIVVEKFAKTFPIYIVDDWKDFDINDVWSKYDSFSWDNWELLDFDKYCKYIGLS